MKKSTITLNVIFILTVLAGSPALLGGCGGGGKANIQTTNSTLGKELQDLDESYKKGIISQKEYDAAKKQLIKKYTK
jgi:hypothetical protein